jgi:hypothetical protein
MFDGVIETAPDGATILRGTIALPSPPLVLGILALFCLLTPITLAIGVGSVVSGSGPGWPFLATMPVYCAALSVAIAATTPRQLRSQSRRLLGELCEILGATTMEP